MEQWRKDLLANPTPALMRLPLDERLEIINELLCHPKDSMSGFESFKHTEETKQQLSRTLKERGIRPPQASDETKRKISAANTGNTYRVGVKASAESKEKMRQAKLGKTISEEHKQKISAGNKGKRMSAEAKAKMSASKTGHVVSDETRKKIADTKRGTTVSSEHRKKISEGLSGKKKPTMTCVHCGITGGSPQIKRWHMDNCKLKGNHQ